MIGATTIAEYRKYVEKDAAWERRFQPVMIEEPSREESIEILKGVVNKYEEHHHVSISEAALSAAVDLSARYINDRNLPDKAIDLIDEASSAARLNFLTVSPKIKEMEEKVKALDLQIEQALRDQEFAKAAELNKEQNVISKKLDRMKQNLSRQEEERSIKVTERDIESVVAMWTNIPVTRIAEKETARLLKLDKELHKRVIGQNDAVEAVTKAIRRGREIGRAHV